MKIIGIIPARYNSKRLPGKPLIRIHGKYLIELTYSNLIKMGIFDAIYIATDSEKINHSLNDVGISSTITSKELINGTERCGELIEKLKDKVTNEDIIVNIQCDEPFIKKSHIEKILSLFKMPVEIGTLVTKMNIKDINNQSVVKVNLDSDDQAIMFSRFANNLDETKPAYKHIGIYAYRKNTLKYLSNLAPNSKELEQKLEQLRWINTDYKIKCGIIKEDILSINTNEDLKKI